MIICSFDFGQEGIELWGNYAYFYTSRKQQIITTEGQSTNDTVEEVEKLRIKHRVSIEHISPYKESYTVNSHWKMYGDMSQSKVA